MRAAKNFYGVCEWSLPVPGPFSPKIAAELGFDGIQIGDLGGAPLNFPLNHPRNQQAYLEAAAEAGIKIHSLHPHTLIREGTMRYPLNSAQGLRAKENLQNIIKACREMNVDTMMVSSFRDSMIRHDYDFVNTAAMLRYACDLGKDAGVRVVYESVLHIDRQLRLLDLVGDDLYILYDTLNPLRYGSGDPIEEMRRIGLERIDHIHVKDAPEEMVGCCLLGTGVGHFEEIAAFLKDFGYSGWYITENYYAQPPFPRGSDSYALAKEDLMTMRRVFG